MPSNITSWSFSQVNTWLRNINLETYINNFQKYDVNGYDLYNLNNDDFIQLKISNFHDKNLMLKSIKIHILEQLKIKFIYELKTIEIQLDFDPTLTVEKLCLDIGKIFNISEEIYLSIDNGNCLLMPNVKIIELILLDPEKYKKLQIITKRNINFSDNNNIDIYNNYNLKPKSNYLHDEKNKGYKTNYLNENKYINLNDSNYNLDTYKINNKEINTPPSEKELNNGITHYSFTPNNRKIKKHKKELKKEMSYNTLNFIYDDEIINNNYQNDFLEENMIHNKKLPSNIIFSFNNNKIINDNYNKSKEIKNNKNKLYECNNKLEDKDLMKTINNEKNHKDFNYINNYNKENYNDNYKY